MVVDDINTNFFVNNPKRFNKKDEIFFLDGLQFDGKVLQKINRITSRYMCITE